MQLIATLPADCRDLQGADNWRGFAVPPDGLDMLVGWSARLQAAQSWGIWVAVWRGEVVAKLAFVSAVGGVRGCATRDML